LGSGFPFVGGSGAATCSCGFIIFNGLLHSFSYFIFEFIDNF
jgi:hypothetical protein